jgi:ATP-dependent DNA ligase
MSRSASHEVCRSARTLAAVPRIAFAHICKLALEGIVSKRRGTAYESGRSDRWVKTINPNAPAVTRLLEEEWNR